VRSRLPAALLAVLALAACTHAKKKPQGEPPVDARARLSVLAQAAANGTYDAQFSFVQRASGKTGTIRIRQAPPRYRIDIVSKDAKASYFLLTTGVVACSHKPHKDACFLAARPGEPVPALFDPGIQRLFRDAVQELAKNPDDYAVTQVSPTPSVTPTPSASGDLPTGECFDVRRLSSSPPPGGTPPLEDGTYCFAEQGLPTSIDVASGTMTLTALGPPPNDKAFQPFAKVQQLPALTPTPTPKNK
jgi:hypothetical protein